MNVASSMHVDFSFALTTIFRFTDDALRRVVVDCIEGVCVTASRNLSTMLA